MGVQPIGCPLNKNNKLQLPTAENGSIDLKRFSAGHYPQPELPPEIETAAPTGKVGSGGKKTFTECAGRSHLDNKRRTRRQQLREAAERLFAAETSGHYNADA